MFAIGALMTIRTLFIAAFALSACATSPSSDGASTGGGGGGGKADSDTSCEDYTDSDACAAAGCEWYPGTVANGHEDLCLAN